MPLAPVKQNSIGIIVVVAFGVIGFMISSLVINNNLMQYASIPSTVTIKVRDGAGGPGDSAIFNLPVKSKFVIDTLKKQEQPASSIVERNLLYHQNPSFPVWGMLILIMVTIASASFPMFTGQIFQLRKIFGLKGKQLAISIGCAVLIIAYLAVSNSSGKGYYKAPKIIDDFHILLNNGNILVGIVLATILLMLPVLAVMFLIGPCSDKLLSEVVTKENFAVKADGLQRLNQTLKNALQVLAIIVAFSVLTSGTLREAIKNTIEITGYDIFPKQICYVYGLYFSLFLCIMYVPTYIYLKQQFKYLASAATQLGVGEQDEEKAPGWTDFKNSAFDNIKLAATMLSPLLASFLPQNFHFFQ